MTRSTVFAPFDIVEGDRKRGIVLLADHARRDLPEDYGSLGLPAAEFDRHIAYDIGVEMVTRELAGLLDVPAVIANFSRLLIDPNRGEDDPTLIRQLYDGTVVPGNYPIAPEEREKVAKAIVKKLKWKHPWYTVSAIAREGTWPLCLDIQRFFDEQKYAAEAAGQDA